MQLVAPAMLTHNSGRPGPAPVNRMMRKTAKQLGFGFDLFARSAEQGALCPLLIPSKMFYLRIYLQICRVFIA